MTAYHKRDFASRFAQMGDAAEGIYDELNPRHHKLGLNRPPFSMAQMDPMLRYLPDRMEREAFVEVMGIGRDKTLKLKIEKIAALLMWQVIADVDLFVSSSASGATWRAPIEDWLTACIAYGEVSMFPEGKAFVALHSDHFPTTTQEHLDAAA